MLDNIKFVMIKVENVSKVYGKKSKKDKKSTAFKALDNVSFDIKEGETVAIVGKSGSGKSTLMHVISGLDKATTGKIFVGEKDISTLKGGKMDEFRNTTIGFIFQTFFVQPNETCLENVMLPLEIAGVSMFKRKSMAMEALKKVDMQDKGNQKANDLSGGQKQRLCIARALVNNPKIIFADEPTGNLDSANGEKVEELLFGLNQQFGVTLIFVTHDEDLAKKCERRIYLHDGKIVKVD